jgi:hypothetical protein
MDETNTQRVELAASFAFPGSWIGGGKFRPYPKIYYRAKYPWQLRVLMTMEPPTNEANAADPAFIPVLVDRHMNYRLDRDYPVPYINLATMV